MKRFARTAALLLGLCCLDGAVAGDTQAEALVAAVRAQRADGAFRIRLFVTQGSGGAAGVNLLLKGERAGSAEHLDIAALSPAALRGQHVRLHVDDGAVSRFEQVGADGAVTALKSSALAEGVFGTDLSFDDLLGRAWSWTPVGVVGSSRVLEHDCRIVELRPPQADPVARLRSCIAPDLGLPLLSERHDAQGRVLQRYRAQALTKQQGRWAVRAFDVERPIRGSVSHVRIVGAEIDSTAKQIP